MYPVVSHTPVTFTSPSGRPVGEILKRGWGRMKVTYSIDKPRRWIITRAVGCVAFDDIWDHQDRLLVDPNFDPSFDQLIDTTPAIMVDITPDEARILAARPIASPTSCQRLSCDEASHLRPGAHDGGVPCGSGIRRRSHGFYSMGEALSWLAGRLPRPR